MQQKSKLTITINQPAFDGFDVLPELLDPFFGKFVVSFELVMLVHDSVHPLDSFFGRRLQLVIPVRNEVHRLGRLRRALGDKECRV